MFATQFLSPTAFRIAMLAIRAARKILILAGLVFVLGLVGTYRGHSGLLDGLQAMFPAGAGATEGHPDAAARPVAMAEAPLTPSMQRALQFVSRRYRVSNEVLLPIFQTAEDSARVLGLDPLLIIAVIGVESGFNPFSQSVVGAQGLMQVMPRFHADKLPDDAGELPFFDPVTNVQVGARILKESITRNGGLIPGLQQFGGAIHDPDRRYSSKVMAEKQRLQDAIQRMQSV